MYSLSRQSCSLFLYTYSLLNSRVDASLSHVPGVLVYGWARSDDSALIISSMEHMALCLPFTLEVANQHQNT